jgi:peptidoglycan/LPS O-acetylase OafA/YrhL
MPPTSPAQARSGERQDTQGKRLGYLPGLDGLRALAVIAVILYHADLGWAPGGFLGVEIFFVISGYLITSLLLVEWQTRGQIDFKNFWLRRARRLLPALYLVIASVLTFAVLFLPDEVASLRGDALAALGYATNWYFILVHKSYFATIGRPSLFQHLWSLAVEEQFYVLWPLLLTLLLKLFQPRRAVFLVIAGALASTALMALLYQPDVDPSRIYYGTDTRAAGLLAGAALAFLWKPWLGQKEPWRKKKKPRRFQKKGWRPDARWLDVLGLAALAALVVECLRISEFDPLLYQGGFALVSLTTLVVIAAAVHPRARLGEGLLGRQPLRWIGQRSYGIYLWHYPIFMVTRPQLDVPLDGLPLLALRLAATFVIAELSYRLVETPIRSGAIERAWQGLTQARGRRRWQLGLSWAGGLAATVLLIVTLGSSVARAQAPAPPAWYSQTAIDTTSPPAASTPVAVAATTNDTASSVVSSVSGVSSVADSLATPTVQPTPTQPSNAAGQDDLPLRQKRTVNQPTPASSAPTLSVPGLAVTSTLTSTLAPGVAPRVFAIGDSVMLAGASALEKAIAGIEVDAALGRQVSTAIEILKTRRAANQLPSIVVVDLGTNGTFSDRQFDQIMSILSDTRRVVFVNVKVPRAWQDANNAVLARGVPRYPNAVPVDWYTASESHPEYFWKDGIHPRPEGAVIYAGLIAVAVNAP